MCSALTENLLCATPRKAGSGAASGCVDGNGYGYRDGYLSRTTGTREPCSACTYPFPYPYPSPFNAPARGPAPGFYSCSSTTMLRALTPYALPGRASVLPSETFCDVRRGRLLLFR